MPTSLDRTRDRETALLRSQIQRGRPWPRGWNWLVNKPHQVGVTRRIVVAILYVTLGVLGLIGLTPESRAQADTLHLIASVLWTAMLPAGCAWAWSALRLHQFNHESPT